MAADWIVHEAVLRVCSGEPLADVQSWAEKLAERIEAGGGDERDAMACRALARAARLAQQDAGIEALESAVHTAANAAVWWGDPHALTAVLMLSWVFRALSGWRPVREEADGGQVP